jgi:dUTP pyrophosphatase
MEKIKIKALHRAAKLPTYATDGSGAFDFYAVDHHVLLADSTEVVPLGLAIAIPEEHVLLLFSRSGHGFKRDIRLSNCVGVIDSDYRGEVMAKFKSDAHSTNSPHYFQPGDAVVQGIIVYAPKWDFEFADELDETERGEGGFGHTDEKRYTK